MWHAEGWWSLDTPHLPHDAISYSDEVRAAHRALWRSGHAVDFVRPGADASGYRLLVVPALSAMTAETAQWLEEYVSSGGHLVVTFASGVTDEHQRIVLGGYPGMLRSLLGVRAEQIFPLADDDIVQLSTGLEGGVWTELLHLESADALATYESGTLSGLPAITRRELGHGTVTYVSTKLAQASLDSFLAQQAAEAGALPVLDGALAFGVEAVRRRGATTDYLFLLHHGDRAVRVDGAGHDLLTGATDRILLQPGGVAVIREANPAWSISAPATV